MAPGRVGTLKGVKSNSSLSKRDKVKRKRDVVKIKG